MREQVLGDAPAVVFRADPARLRHADIVEEDFALFGKSIETDNRADRHSGVIGAVQQQEGDALLLAAFGAGAHQHEHAVGVVGVGGPDLGPVDDVIIAIGHRAARQRGEIRT